MKITNVLVLIIQGLMLLVALVRSSSEPGVIQHIGDKWVEEHEIMTLQMSDYFSGQFLKYSIDIASDSEFVNRDLSTMIYQTQPFNKMSWQFITDFSFERLKQRSFPRSSLIMDDYKVGNRNGTTMSLHFVTRDFKFMSYNLSKYTEEGSVVDKTFEIQLNQSALHNAECSDLNFERRYSPMRERFIFFCRLIRPRPPQQGQTDDFQTLFAVILLNKTQININSTETDKIVRHYQFPAVKFGLKIDFRKGLKEIELPSGLIPSGLELYNQKYYLGFILDNHDDRTRYGSIIALNLSLFDEMADLNLNWLQGNQPILLPLHTFSLDNIITDMYTESVDLMSLFTDAQNEEIYIALALDSSGVMICSFGFNQLINITSYILQCTKKNSQLVKVPGYRIQQLYKVQSLSWQSFEDHDPYFYGINTRPSSIIEFDMSDIDNVIVNKVYMIDSYKNDEFIGTFSMAVNKNYVVHLVQNPDTLEQQIRLFNRDALLYSAPKYQLAVNSDTVVDFFQFPSHLFNIAIFRDERTLNVTSFVEHSLIFNATNSSLVARFKNDPIVLRVCAENNIIVIVQKFNVTFIDSLNTSITSMGKAAENSGLDIFYNCGELSMDYQITDFFNGPNFNLTQVLSNQANDPGYFKFENQEIQEFQRATFDFSKCRQSYLFPYQSYFDSVNPRDQQGFLPTVLVCIDTNNSLVSSYLINQDSTFTKTNEIALTGIKMINFQIDHHFRTIFALTASPRPYVNETRNYYEIHIFKVSNQVIWQKMLPYYRTTNLTMISYSGEESNLVFIEYRLGIPNDPIKQFRTGLEIIRIFKYDQKALSITLSKIGSFTDVNETERIVKVKSSSQHVIYAMTMDKRISVYQIDKRVEKRRDIFFRDIVNFDIFGRKYFVVYRESNVIEVYTIDMYIYLSYKMRLPLYQEYESFTFKLGLEYNHVFQRVVRAYQSEFLSVLMTNRDSGITRIFVYELDINQHNSFVMTRDWSDQFTIPSTNARLIVTGDEQQVRTVFGAISENEIRLYDVRFFNKLTLKNDTFQQLIEACKDVKLYFNSSNSKLVDNTKLIEVVSVKPMTLFTDFTTIQESSFTFDLRVQSQNQGLAVTTKSDLESKVVIKLTNDSQLTSSPIELLHETFMEGQNLKFSTTCSYNDKDGIPQDCTDAAQEDTKTQPYSFIIEQVTSQRQIVRSFTIGKLFFMFDTLFQVLVYRLPYYQDSLDEVDGQALILLFSGNQSDKFGCEITGFADYYKLDEIDYKNEQKSETYIIFYHCEHNDFTKRMVVRAALITVYPHSSTMSLENQPVDNVVEPFEISKLSMRLPIPYEIIDLEIFKISYNPETKIVTMLFAVTCKISQSYTNLLNLYSVEVYLRTKLMNEKFIYSLNANNMNRDSFLVTKLLPIPGSNLMIVVIEDYGIQILNLTRLMNLTFQEKPKVSEFVLAEIDAMQSQDFKDQEDQKMGRLEVYAVTGNLPNSVLMITNYGVIILDFPVDLTSTDQIIEVKDSLKPITSRQIRLHYDYLSGYVAHNDYGSAFLVNKYLGEHNYEVALIAISFYSAPNSRIFKTIDITWNEQCISLNMDSYYMFSPEDQISVSFICNSYLQIQRVCMRPNVVIELDRYVTELGNRGLFQIGSLSESRMFNITIESSNEQSKGKVNTESVSVILDYTKSYKRGPFQSFVLLAIVGIVGLLIYVIFYFDFTLSNRSKSKKEREESEIQETVVVTLKSSQITTTTTVNPSDYALNRSIADSSISFFNSVVPELEEQRDSQEPVYIPKTVFQYVEVPTFGNPKYKEGMRLSTDIQENLMDSDSQLFRSQSTFNNDFQ